MVRGEVSTRGVIWDATSLAGHLVEPDAALALLLDDREALGVLADRPLLMVRAHGPAAVEVGALARQMPCVAVAMADDHTEVPAGIETAGYDILLTSRPAPPAPWVGPTAPAHSTGSTGSAGSAGSTVVGPDPLLAAAAALVDMTGRFPLASVALTQLLRYAAGLDVRDGVVAESFTYSSLQAGPEFARWLVAHRERRALRAVAGASRRAGASRGARASAGSGPAEPAVLVDRDGGTLEILLNRPRVHNAVNTALRDGLVAALALAESDPTIEAVRLRGVGPSFCSGGDLTEFGELDDPARAHAIRTTRSIPLAVVRCADRVTAYVHGTCVGAGVEVPSFAGRVIADPATTFRLPEVPMGLVPGAGGTAGITRRVGRERTAFLALTGWALGAQDALDWGLVDALGPVPTD